MTSRTRNIVVLMAFAVIIVSAAAYFIISMDDVGRTGTVKTQVRGPNIALDSRKKRILYVDSYHEEYPWSYGITKGVKSILDSRDDIELKITRMDSKRNNSEEYKKAAAIKVKKMIDDWQPDVVIASDDNASKYLIVPFFQNNELPFVFCGVNYDASAYGFPSKNVTGMLEVALIPQLIETLTKHAKGKRIGFLFPDTFSEIKSAKHIKKFFNIDFQEKYVSTYDEWKSEFIHFQSSVDLLIVRSYEGIDGFDIEDAVDFVKVNTKIPTGATLEMMLPLVLISYAKIPEEQGEWAATRALEILSGVQPSDIPLAYNEKGNVGLNFELAARQGVAFNKNLVAISSTGMATGEYSYSEISKKNYQGKILNILTHEIPVMGEPTLLHARQFEKLTGMKINIHHVPFGELYQEALLGLKNAKYDIVFYGSLWVADMYKYLEPVPLKLLQSDSFIDIIPHYQSIAKWGEITYQVNVDGDRHYLQYRKDLIENIQYKKEFKQAYGEELYPPKTWKELNKIASFFNEKRLNSGETIYGIAEITLKDDLLFSQFIKRAAPYAKHPDIKDGFYFELQTMKPLINTPGFVEALQNFIESQAYYPPEGNTFGLADVIMSFGKGETVFSDSWDDSFIQSMERASGISAKVATSLSPGSRIVWNRKTEKWDDFPEVNYAPYFAWGWTSAVAKSSANKDAAFDYLGFFANNENHFSDLLVGRFGVNPYRTSDYNVSFWVERAGWEKSTAESYVKTLKDMAASDNWVMDLRIHESRQYMNALAIGVYRAISGRDTAQKALDEVARRWDVITERVGRDKQREAYSFIVEFENKNFNMDDSK